MDATPDTVKSLIDDLQQGELDAAQELWNLYFERLARTAQQKLAAGLRRTVDGEDVAASVMRTIYRRAADGQLATVGDRQDLWQLMVTILRHKAIDLGRKHRTEKRGGGAVRGDSVFVEVDSSEQRPGFAQFPTDAPTPDLIVQLEEERLRLFERLADDQMRAIAQQRLEGAATEEIAEALQLSPRTVRRKLEAIRECWSQLANA